MHLDKFQNFYGDKFGKDNLTIIKDSKNVEVGKLNPEKAYIQITYVEPFFDNFELRDRVTIYEKNFNISKSKLKIFNNLINYLKTENLTLFSISSLHLRNTFHPRRHTSRGTPRAIQTQDHLDHLEPLPLRQNPNPSGGPQTDRPDAHRSGH